MLNGTAEVGAQATSRTQSVWGDWPSLTSSTHFSEFSDDFHRRTELSHEPVITARRTVPSDVCVPRAPNEAQEMELHPSVSFWKKWVVLQTCWTKNNNELAYHASPLYSRIETRPSEEAHASISPNSWGAHDIEFTEQSWTLCSKILVQLFVEASRWIKTDPS